jgi:DNA gyrase subunit A
MLITNEGVIIRTSVSSINVYSRTATGVIVMRLNGDAYINNVARLEKAEEIEEASEAIDKEIAESTPVSKDSEKENPNDEEDSL